MKKSRMNGGLIDDLITGIGVALGVAPEIERLSATRRHEARVQAVAWRAEDGQALAAQILWLRDHPEAHQAMGPKRWAGGAGLRRDALQARGAGGEAGAFFGTADCRPSLMSPIGVL